MDGTRLEKAQTPSKRLRVYGAAGGGRGPNWARLGDGTDAEIMFARNARTTAESAALAELIACVPIIMAFRSF